MTKYILPPDLLEAEKEMQASVMSYICSNDVNRLISLTIKFEGLRVNPIVYRLTKYLLSKRYHIKLLFPDIGSAALARRDMDDLEQIIYSFTEFSKLTDQDVQGIIIVVSPQPYEIQSLESMCNKYDNLFIMLNGKFEDPLVGVGQVGRERRKRFNSTWEPIYYLEPIAKGAIKKDYPNPWQLYKNENGFYTFTKVFKKKPDEETIFLHLDLNER